MNITQVNTGTLNKKNSVFVAFYTEAYHHYQTNDECRDWGEQCWNTKIALLGTMMRWDGSFGFVGGKVDEGETLKQAAIREVFEEVGSTIQAEQLTLLCSHEMIDGHFHQNTHVYLCKVTPKEMYTTQQNSVNSEHGKIESSGFNVVHMVDEAFSNLPNLVWAGTAKEELNILLQSENIERPVLAPNGTF